MGLKRKTPLRPKKRLGNKRPSIGAMIKSGVLSKASAFKPRRKPMRKQSATNNGWWWKALEIWAERPHKCAVCKKPLGDVPRPHFFSHLLTRSGYRRYKTDERNIVIKCTDCHDEWHDRGPDKLSGVRRWKDVTDLYFSLRDEANGVV